MRYYEKALRAGLGVVLCALCFRGITGGTLQRAAAMLAPPETQAPLPVRELLPDYMESPPPQWEEPVPVETLPEITGEETVSVYNTSGRTLDIPALLSREPDFGETPAVLIYSTHTTESYRKQGEPYTESAPYRTTDPSYNMCAIGALVARRLEERGIPVILDTELHDYPTYNSAYSHARKAVAEALAECPWVALAVDLHRDASPENGAQLRTCAQVEGTDCAQLMLVLGTDAALKHPDWQENLALGLRLQLRLEQLAPGITRPINLRRQRFNQDLSPGALLVEVGAAGNTHQEALRAAEILAQALGDLVLGSPATADSAG